MGASKQTIIPGDVVVQGNLTVYKNINKGLQSQVNSVAASGPSAAVGANPQSPALIPSGWSGWTSTPTAPTIQVVAAQYSLVISWDQQTDLLDFQRYEIQCSPDNSNWYSLSNNMGSGLGTLNALTQTASSVYVHMLASGTLMYYRVRRVNKVSGSDNDGAWSTVKSNTSGDGTYPSLAAATIYAQTLVVGDLYYFGKVASQTNPVPVTGDLRSYLTKGDINIDEYLASAWVTLFSVAAGAATNLLDLTISGRVFARDSVLSAIGRFWTSPTALSSATDNILSIALGQGGVGIAASGTLNALHRTTDGATWTAITSPFASGYNNIYVATDGAGNWVATASESGAAPEIAYSTDNGATWALATSPFAAADQALFPAWNGTTFCVMAAGSGKVSTSTNGITWSSTSSTQKTAGVFLSSGNGIFVSGNSTGGQYSSDGVTWTALSLSSVTAAAYYEGVWIIGGVSGAIERSSDNLSTFSSVTGPSTLGTITNIVAGAGMFLMTDGVGNTCRSLDLGLTWGTEYGDNQTTIPAGMNIVYGLAFSSAWGRDGRFYAGGNITSSFYAGVVYSDYVEAGAGIVESGSNSNGSYVKYADGTMVQVGGGGPYTTGTTSYNGFYIVDFTLTFPVPFFSVTAVVGRSNRGNLTTLFGVDWTTTTVLAEIGKTLSGSPTYFSYVAWGKWK